MCSHFTSIMQDAINLFLGNFIPGSGQLELWELESDVYLHAAGGFDRGFDWVDLG